MQTADRQSLLLQRRLPGQQPAARQRRQRGRVTFKMQDFCPSSTRTISRQHNTIQATQILTNYLIRRAIWYRVVRVFFFLTTCHVWIPSNIWAFMASFNLQYCKGGRRVVTLFIAIHCNTARICSNPSKVTKCLSAFTWHQLIHILGIKITCMSFNKHYP